MVRLLKNIGSNVPSAVLTFLSTVLPLAALTSAFVGSKLRTDGGLALIQLFAGVRTRPSIAGFPPLLFRHCGGLMLVSMVVSMAARRRSNSRRSASSCTSANARRYA